MWRNVQDPLIKARQSLTKRQRSALNADAELVVAEGGNQSGKSFVATVDCVSYLLNEHPVFKWNADAPPSIWYSTTTYPRFAEQAWGHIKDLLLFPGESEYKLPSHRIRKIEWLTSGSIPRIIHLTNGTSLWVKSYDQGPGEFQAKSLSYCVVDEECPEKIWAEIQLRRVATHHPRIFVAATPILGVEWLANLRDMAMESRGDVYHVVLPTIENPACNEKSIESLKEQFRDRPDELALRLYGKPYSRQGLVYPDGLWKPEHICKPFEIPKNWAKYRCVDHGINNCACIWIAVSPDEKNIVVFRDYLGKQKRIAENAQAICSYEMDGERYVGSYIDSATHQRDAESGERIIDLWRYHGWRGNPAPDNRVDSGIERVRDLLARWNYDFDRPVFRVFDYCHHFLRERRQYKYPDLKRTHGDDRPERPVKTDDHVMDCWRYLVAARLKYKENLLDKPMPDPKTNPIGYAFWSERYPEPKETL